ncbi:hypothetical protein L7F22_018619 [Adiantum nelumboides]|nr:hypothetical protein [Adiantum nelumboides]
MPSNSSGRRRVRCPKCTARLTEPELQTQIYECPVCATLLLAKGYGISRSSDNRLHISGGDAEDIQKILDGGSKLEKASLMFNDQELLRGESVDSENSRDLDRESNSRSEGCLPLVPSDQSLSGAKLSKQSSSRSANVSTKLSAEISHPEKLGEMSPSHESGHRSSDLDSASHSESETYLDSPLWSSENANASEVAEVSFMVNSLEVLSFANSSNEPLSTFTSLDCTERLREENDSGKDAKNDDKNRDTTLQSTEGSCHDKVVDYSSATSLDDSANGISGNTSIETLPSSLLERQTRGGGSKSLQNDVDCKEMPNVGKFRLFDLSVFGIYNEDTYNELIQGKVAHFGSLAENGDSIQPPAENKLGSQLSELAAEGLSSEKHGFGAQSHESSLHSEKDGFGAQSHESSSHFEKDAGTTSDSSVIDTGGNYTGTGDTGKMYVNVAGEGTDAQILDSFGREGDNVGFSKLEDGNLLPVCGDRDNDALARARYGDDLVVREFSSEGATVDISFGDWRSQQVSKSSHSALEPDPDADDDNENKTMNLAVEEDTDSSWGDDDGLTFSSSAKVGVQLKGTDPMDEVQEDSLGGERNGGSEAEKATEKSTFSLRTTAMQKFLHRDDQQNATFAQPSQSPTKAASVLYEAPYVEHYSPLLGKGPQEASDQALPLMAEHEERNLPPKQEHDSHGEASNDTKKGNNEHQSQSLPSAHSSPASSIKSAGATPEHWREEDGQLAHAKYAHSRKDTQLVARRQEDGALGEMDCIDQEPTALASQKSDYVNQWTADKLGIGAGMPVSLRWKGKGSSTQSISSTEDEGAYGIESEAGSGAEKDLFREEAVGRHGRPFPDKEGVFGSGLQPREPTARVSQRTWVGSIEASRQRSGSGELATSRRTARSRPSNERLLNQGPLIGAERLLTEERSYDSESSRRTGLSRPAEQFHGYLGPGMNLSGGEFDKRSNYIYSGTADYNSDASSRSQDVPHRFHYKNYPSNSASAGTAGTYAFQLPFHGSVPLAASHEQGLSHSALTHHCLSPSCSVCIQQQYFLQQSHIHQDTMLHQCAACAAQASAAYQPMHHPLHGHHIHYSNPSTHHHNSGVLPAGGRTQIRSSVQHSHPVLLARRMKHYPPLPGKGAPPFVLCRHCNQLLQVPEYLPPTSGTFQSLHCGACGKTSKFSNSQSDNRVFFSTGIGVTANESARHEFVARDKQRTDIPSAYSSGQSSPSGVLTSAQNLYEKGRLISGQGSQRAWVENRASSRPNAYEIPSTQSDFVGSRHQLRPMAGTTGSGQPPYGSNVRHISGNHASNETGLYKEDYFSSSPSSASGASPGRQSQISRDNQRAQPLTKGRPPLADLKFRPDSPSWTTLHEHGRPPPEGVDSLFQKRVSESRSRVSGSSLQGSVCDPIDDSPNYARVERFDTNSKAGNWHDLANVDYSARSTPRRRVEQGWKLPAAPGSPLIEHFTQDVANDIPSAQHRHSLQNSGNGSRSTTPWSPKSGSQASPPHDPYGQDALADFGGRSYEDDHLRLPVQDGSKGPKSFAGLLKRSIKDLGKGGQGGGNRRKVVVNGYFISEAAVRKAEERAGPIHSGTYWYDYQAGFWGIMGGPCLGILMPCIEEFQFPLARDCAGGKTGILVNGRELHDKDLEVLAKRGLPTSPGKAYILDISGALFDDITNQPLKGLGKLAPSIEKRGRGFGMSPFTAQC